MPPSASGTLRVPDRLWITICRHRIQANNVLHQVLMGSKLSSNVPTTRLALSSIVHQEL